MVLKARVASDRNLSEARPVKKEANFEISCSFRTQPLRRISGHESESHVGFETLSHRSHVSTIDQSARQMA
jgi:hypothetical protein